MGGETNFGAIRDAIKKNKRLAEVAEGGYETEEHEWNSYDSPLEGAENCIADTFITLVPKEFRERDPGHRFRGYIETTLSGNDRQLTGIELGGPGSMLFGGFTKGFFGKTLGVCLKDIRSDEIKISDEGDHHYVVPGDITDVLNFNTLLRAQIDEVLGSTKTDLIISRMRGPLQFIDKNLALLDRQVRNWYEMLNDNGLMFSQFSHEDSRENDELIATVRRWSEQIKAEFPSIEIEVDKRVHSRVEGVLRLHKKIGSPTTLPRQ